MYLDKHFHKTINKQWTNGNILCGNFDKTGKNKTHYQIFDVFSDIPQKNISNILF